MLSKLMWRGGCVVCGGVLKWTPLLSKLMWRAGCVDGSCQCRSLKLKLSRWLDAKIALLSSAPGCSDFGAHTAK